jgi:TolA-binding protein
MVVLLMGLRVIAQTTLPASPDASPVASTRPADVSSDLKIVERFVESVRVSTTVEPAARDAVVQMWNQRQPGDEPRAMMNSTLAILSPAYKKALDAMEAARYAEAREALQPLMSSAEFCLAAHAKMLAARSFVEEERTEQAQEILDGLAADREQVTARTLVGPEMLFLLGYCQLANLQYDQAAATLEEFDRRYPEAPDQYRLPVRQMMQELAARQPEGLGDVSDLMGYAGRQLKHARTGEAVQTRQQRAVDLLDKLVDEAQQREQQAQQAGTGCKKCGGKGCKECRKSGLPQGNRAAQRAAERSALPGGQGRIGDLHRSAQARPGEEWGKMRPEERERILQAVRQNFPSRYRQLVEQYYKQLAKEE